MYSLCLPINEGSLFRQSMHIYVREGELAHQDVHIMSLKTESATFLAISLHHPGPNHYDQLKPGNRMAPWICEPGIAPKSRVNHFQVSINTRVSSFPRRTLGDEAHSAPRKAGVRFIPVYFV